MQLGFGSVAAGALLRPTEAQADETTPVEATIRQGPVPFMMGDTASAVSIMPYGSYQGATVRMASVPTASRGAMNRLNLISAGAGAGVRANWIPAGGFRMADATTVEFWAYLESPTVWPNGDPASGAMGYLTFGDLNFTRVFSAFFTLRPGWNHVRIGRSQFAAIDGSPSWNDVFALMQITMNPCSAGPVSVYVGDFRKAGKDRPLISVMFDDGEDSVRQYAMPVLANARIPATIAVISSMVGKSFPARTFSSMNQLSSWPSGTAFVNHTVNHRRGYMTDPGTPYANVLKEIRDCQLALTGLPGFDPAMFAAPYGEWGTAYFAALKEAGVLYSRCMVSGAGAGYQGYAGCRLDNPYLAPAFAVGRDASAASVLSYVDQGIASGQSMILLFHDIRPIASAALDYQLDKFTQVINGLAARSSLADFVTMPKLYRRLSMNGMV